MEKNIKTINFKHQLQLNDMMNDAEYVKQYIQITWSIIFCIRYSRLYWVYHKEKHEVLTDNLPIKIHVNKTENRVRIKII